MEMSKSEAFVGCSLFTEYTPISITKYVHNTVNQFIRCGRFYPAPYHEHAVRMPVGWVSLKYIPTKDTKH